MKNSLWLSALLGLTVLAGCSKTETPEPGAGKPKAAAATAAKDLPPPMPGATPFKLETPPAPDPVALQKAIDAQRAQQEKEAKATGKADSATTDGVAAEEPAKTATPEPTKVSSEKAGKSR